jgi:hypothetical protein
MLVKNLTGSRKDLQTSSAIVSELSCSHNVRALKKVMSHSKTPKKTHFCSLPADLAHEPPQEPRSLHEGMLGVARDGVHMLHDGFGT